MSNLDDQKKLTRETYSRENEHKNNQKEYGENLKKSTNDLHEAFSKILIDLEVITPFLEHFLRYILGRENSVSAI